MARVHHYRRRHKEAPELEMTTFLNLMVVLVPFLLITAVFSRIAISERLATRIFLIGTNAPPSRCDPPLV